MRAHTLPALLLILAACEPAAEPSVPTPAPPDSASATPPVATATIRHAVVVLSRPSGSNTTTVGPDGSRETTFDVLQNGRGPSVKARITMAADGTIVSLDASGHDTMGIGIDEHFKMEGKRATWKSRAESGSKEVSGPAFYVPLASLPDTMGLLVDALVKAGGKIALLPEGDAVLEKGSTAEVTSSKGEKVKLEGYRVLGLDLTPTHVWVNADTHAFFGLLDSWSWVLPEGFEGAGKTLIDLQEAADFARDKDVARRLAHKPPAAGLAITHARLFDAASKKTVADQTIVVVGEKIESVGPSKTAKIPAGAEVVDATGKTVTPGLWDMHSHLGPPDGVLDVASGVTTARDVGNEPDTLDRYKDRFDRGEVVGPHVLRAGFIEGRGEKAAGAKITAETEEEAKAGVEFFYKRGYVQMKIYNSMKPELVPVIAKAAHEKGMRVSGHVPVHMRAEDAVRAGYDEINHVNMLFLNFFIDKDTDTRTPLRFSIVAEKAPGLDLGSKPVKDFLGLLVQRKTVVDPTLGVFEYLFMARLGEMSPGVVPIASRLPVQVRRGYLTGGIPVPEGKDQLYKDAFTACKKMVKALHDNGIPIVTGTDAMAGVMLHRELELHVAAGLTPAEALQNASLGAARVMRVEKTTGSVEKGKVADLAIFDGDPTARIEDVRKVSLVVKAGVVFKSAELYPEVGIRN